MRIVVQNTSNKLCKAIDLSLYNKAQKVKIYNFYNRHSLYNITIDNFEGI